MLKIRSLTEGSDETAWISVLNAAYENFSDWRTLTEEDFLQQEMDSGLSFDERWIAEIDGNPVGAVHAFTRDMGEETVGFIDDLAIPPSSLKLGVEGRLAQFASNQLRAHGAERILVPRLRWYDTAGEYRAVFLEKLGFRLTRMTSLMEMDLRNTPSDIIQDNGMTLKPSLGSKKDIETLSWLRNECSKGQFNFRPMSIQETQSFLENNSYSYLEVFFATFDRKPVGFLVVAIDEKFNVEKKAEAGIILAVGVLKQHRRRGIGKRLVLHGLQVLKTKEMTSALLDVDDLNQTGAQKLYERLGFEVSEKYLTYERPDA